MMINAISQFLGLYISNYVLGVTLMIGIGITAVLGVWERLNHDMCQSDNKDIIFWGVTANQIATYFDFMASIILGVYAFELITNPHQPAYFVISLIFLLNVTLRKIGIFLSYSPFIPKNRLDSHTSL